MASRHRILKFFGPENTLRTVELLFAVFVFSASFGWSDQGISYTDLHGGDYNDRDNIVFFIIVGLVSLLFLISALIYSLARCPRILSPGLDILASSSLSLLTFVASVVLAHALTHLGQSTSVKEAGLRFGTFQVALVFSLALTLLFAASSTFAVGNCRKKMSFTVSLIPDTADLPNDMSV